VGVSAPTRSVLSEFKKSGTKEGRGGSFWNSMKRRSPVYYPNSITRKEELTTGRIGRKKGENEKACQYRAPLGGDATDSAAESLLSQPILSRKGQ